MSRFLNTEHVVSSLCMMYEVVYLTALLDTSDNDIFVPIRYLVTSITFSKQWFSLPYPIGEILNSMYQVYTLYQLGK